MRLLKEMSNRIKKLEVQKKIEEETGFMIIEDYGPDENGEEEEWYDTLIVTPRGTTRGRIHRDELNR